MFAIKDVESIKNLAAILTIPLFAAAYVSDGALETIRDPVLDWLRNNDIQSIKLFGWVVWFLIVVAIVTFVFSAVDFGIIWLHVWLDNSYFMAWVGFSCITAGLLVLSIALPGLPQRPINPLWHLALLCYGFSLVDRAAK